jgi:hypothetical protein
MLVSQAQGTKWHGEDEVQRVHQMAEGEGCGVYPLGPGEPDDVRRAMAKVGRNEPCPCGSGAKFKRCHGSLQRINADDLRIAEMIRRGEVERYQRQRQQGLGKPIVSTSVGDQRLVAVGNGVYYSNKWQTFHDFLINFLQFKVGKEWWEGEAAKPDADRHPLMRAVAVATEEAKRNHRVTKGVQAAPMTGASGAMFSLAYDLYSLEHNAEIQQKLIDRLRNADNYFGARYEACVAAILIRSGFTIEFENEDDRSSTHCEFTATYTATGDKFSVEAKHRHGDKYRINKYLVAALMKQANYTRVVFIDLNMPDDGSEPHLPDRLDRLFKKLPMMEQAKVPGVGELPPAYVFVTNYPWEHHLRDTNFRTLALFDGFRIPQFSYRHQAPSLREAIEAREQHRAMHDLVKHMRMYGEIPSTFDGQSPELAFSETPVQRMLVGQTYVLDGPDGKPVRGILTDAEVIESESAAMGVFALEGGSSAIYRQPLTDVEMQAWKHHPETFFGVYKKRHQANSALELYDFFLEGFQETPVAAILERLATAPDIEELKRLPVEQLRSIYAERTTLGALAAQNDRKHSDERK